MIKKISLDLKERSYEILVGSGAIGNLGDFLQSNSYSKLVLVIDENVAKYHQQDFINILPREIARNYQANLIKIVIGSGEENKSFRVFEEICEKILQQKIDRKTLVIAFGGGVVGDLAGFIASVLLRGIDFIQIPTTLLAMVDSSVGGKTAINSSFGKNLIGSFYQPKMVICDLRFLETLPARQFLSGYAEVLKYGLICDLEFFQFLQKNRQEILAQRNVDQEIRTNLISSIITRSCEIKAEIVGRDEKESKERALLNFGHSFGHIFETEVNYSDELLHGEAVALGIAMAVKMSQNLKMIDDKSAEVIFDELKKSGFRISPKEIRPNWDKDSLTKHLFADKKTENQQLTFILLQKIGKAEIIKKVPLAEFLKILDNFLPQ